MNEALWVIGMVTHPKAAREFKFALEAIKPIMTDKEALRDEKRETLNMMVSGLSDKTFKLKPIGEQIMTIINMKEDVCKEYLDSEAQVDGILGWLPRMKEFRGMLLGEVRKNRKEYGLKL